MPFLPVNDELGKPENDEFAWVPCKDLLGLLPGRLAPVAQALLDWIEEGR